MGWRWWRRDAGGRRWDASLWCWRGMGGAELGVWWNEMVRKIHGL